MQVELADAAPEDAGAAFAKALPVVATGEIATARPGQPDDSSATAALASIRQAVDHVRHGRAGAVVTNPIAKSVLYRAGFRHPGHTEFLAELAADGGPAPQPVMMLWSPTLAVVPVTIHLSLREAITQLTSELIVTTARIAVADLKARFGLARPRLAISGLNPHAGEDGSLGREDIDSSRRPIEMLRREGIDARGPLPADTMFHAAARKPYDCAICMYHDQALIPIKTIAFDDAVNVTLGLPFIRTSPDHGTAFDIAGTGKANPSSLPPRCGSPRGWRRQSLHERDRRPAAAARRHPRALPVGPQIARPELSARSQPHRTDRARRGPARRHNRDRDRSRPGRADARAAGARRQRVIAIERDERAIAALEEIAKLIPGRLEIVPADAQDFDPRPMLDGERRTSLPTCPTISPRQC